MSHHRQSAESVNGVTGVTGHAKPAKPYPDFPLFPHATRRWAKKIRGKMHYFGPWEDWQGALNRYLEQKDDLYAGRTPRVSTGVSVRLYELNNSFLAEKRRLFDTGEIGQRTLADYEATCDLVGQQFGLNRAVEDLTPKDFADLRDELARRWGPVRLGNEINRIRILFRHGGEDASGLLTKTVRFGTGFKRPSKKTLRLERAAKNPRFFEPECLRQLLAAAEPPLTAMLLLGINCGFGNEDCVQLPRDRLDLAKGWHHYHRPKTGIGRRAKLWPETVAALEEAIARRPRPRQPEHEPLVFLTRFGRPWATTKSFATISQATRKLLDATGLYKQGLSFYSLRHTFETVGGDASYSGGGLSIKDQVAVDYIMGHAKDDMASVYREAVFDERLENVAAHVHRWLFGS